MKVEVSFESDLLSSLFIIVFPLWRYLAYPVGELGELQSVLIGLPSLCLTMEKFPVAFQSLVNLLILLTAICFSRQNIFYYTVL